MSKDYIPFSERGDDDSIDDLLGMMAEAIKSDTENVEAFSGTNEIVNDLVSNVFASKGDMGVLGNFVLVGEVIGGDGNAHLLVVTSDNLPEWVSRGMIMAADDYIASGFLE